MFISSLMKGKFNFHADLVERVFKNRWVYVVGRPIQFAEADKITLHPAQRWAVVPSTYIRLLHCETGAPSRPPLCSHGQRHRKRKHLPSSAITKFRDHSWSHSVVLSCLHLPPLLGLRLPCFWRVLLISLWRSGQWIQQEKPPAAGSSAERDPPPQKVWAPPGSTRSPPPKPRSASAPLGSPTGSSASIGCSPAPVGPRRWWVAENSELKIQFGFLFKNKLQCPCLFFLMLPYYPSALNCPWWT